MCDSWGPERHSPLKCHVASPLHFLHGLDKCVKNMVKMVEIGKNGWNSWLNLSTSSFPGLAQCQWVWERNRHTNWLTDLAQPEAGTKCKFLLVYSHCVLLHLSTTSLPGLSGCLNVKRKQIEKHINWHLDSPKSEAGTEWKYRFW